MPCICSLWVAMTLRDLRGQTSAVVAEQKIADILQSLRSNIQRLIDAGAQSLLLANVADIGRIPQTLELEPGAPGIGVRTTTYVRSFNQQLATMTSGLASDRSLNIYTFDTFAELNRILDAPQAFGFDISTRGCLDPAGGFNPFDFEFDAGCDSGFFPIIQPNFDGYVFFDSIHPTAATHGLIGAAMIERLERPIGRRNFVAIAAITQLLLSD